MISIAPSIIPDCKLVVVFFPTTLLGIVKSVSFNKAAFSIKYKPDTLIPGAIAPPINSCWLSSKIISEYLAEAAISQSNSFGILKFRLKFGKSNSG